MRFQDFMEAVKQLSVFWVLVNAPSPGAMAPQGSASQSTAPDGS